MANSTKDFGFLPWNSPIKGDFEGTEVSKTTGAANYRGDALTLVAAGTYTKAVAGGNIDAIASSSASATATTIKAWVVNSNQKWIINSNAAVAAADRGGAFDIEVGTADTTHNISGDMLDISSINTTGQVVLLDKHPNDTWADDCRCIVKINESKRIGIGVGVTT